MFSWEYVRRAAASAISNPSALLSLLKGDDPGAVVYKRRMDEWARTRQKYLYEPKQTFGFKIFLNQEDMSQISALIASSGWLDLPLTCLLLSRLKPGMKVLDVGANLGYYSLLGAKMVGRSGRVWAFEPEPHNFQLLMRSIRASNFDNIEAIQMALADRLGRQQLYLTPPSEPNAYTITQDRGMGFIETQSTSLDEFWSSRKEADRRIDLIKIHVFGDEPIVLRGARRVLQDSRPMVVTRFGSSRWEEDAGLLDDLFAWYHVYEIVESPSLIRPIAKKSALTPGVHVGIFLSPKGR